MIDRKISKTNFSTYQEKLKFDEILSKFAISNFCNFCPRNFEQTFCKLDKILRNFPSWQMSVFVTVYEIFGLNFAILCHEVAIF